MGFTTTDLINEVRTQIQEKNKSDVTSDMILDTLNRAKDDAFNILAIKYPAPLIEESALTSADSNGEIDVSETSFEDRIQQIDCYYGGNYYEMIYIDYSEVINTQTLVATGRPYYWTIIGRKIKLYPQPAGNYQFRIWSLKEVEELIISQGRISSLGRVAEGESNAYVVLDSLGSDLSTTDPYNKYVNIIDSQTGEIKCSLQINTIDTTLNKLTFKTTTTRSTVLNRTISTDIPSTVEADDYICTIHGSCVLYFKKPLKNYIIQYAVYEIRRSLGYDVLIEKQALKDLKERIQKTWTGRSSNLRVKQKSTRWRRYGYLPDIS